MSDFREQWTAKTFINQDEDSMVVSCDPTEPEIMELNIAGQPFWFNNEDADAICEAILEIANRDKP